MTSDNDDDDSLANPEVERSYKYMQIFKELAEWRGGAYNIAKRLFDQGKADGLPYEVIRKDIEDVLNGVITSRQLTRVLPPELKRSGGYEPRKDIMFKFIAIEDIPNTDDGKLRYNIFVKAYNEASEHVGINGLTPSEMFLQRINYIHSTYNNKQQSVTHVGNQKCNLSV